MPTIEPIAAARIPAWLRKPRTQPVQIILIHATRGDIATEAQYRATVNWFTSAGNRAKDGGGNPLDFGSQSDFCVGAQGEIAQFGDYHATRPNWSAGFGVSFADNAVDDHAISIEVAQRQASDPYTPASIDALVWLCARLASEYSVPIVHIPSWDQSRRQPVPRGFIGHEETANGRKLGKSDPGPMFPWPAFLQRLGTQAQSPGVSRAEFAALVDRVEKLEAGRLQILRGLGVATQKT